MSSCNKCFKAVSRSNKNKVQCKICNGYFHWDCVNLTETEVNIIKSSNTQWTCEPCTRQKRYSRSFSDSCPVEPSSSTMAVTLEAIQGLLDKMKEDLLSSQKDMEAQLGKSINECFDQINENNKLIEDQRRRIDEQTEKISILQGENGRLRAQVKDISERQIQLEQYSRRNTLEIFGLPESPNESTSELKKRIVEIGTTLGANFGEDDIDACHRFGGGRDRPTAGVIVKFLRRDDADNLLQKRKVKRDFSTRHLTGYTVDSTVYVNVSLAPARRVLFAKARKLKSDEFKFKYVWVDRVGRVKARKSDNDRIIFINNEDELSKLMNRETKVGDAISH